MNIVHRHNKVIDTDYLTVLIEKLWSDFSNAIQKQKYQNFVAGWSAGFVETLQLYPQTKVIFRQQLQGITAKGVFGQLRNEGCWMLYRGMLSPLIQRTAT
uniref:Uncharacterized protein n=1 Tax=Wuchereria bancrofti TaxID=6293 RepID=A0AAF5PKX6_WUCBA